MAILKDRSIAAPVQNPESTHYWNAAREGRLLMRQCRSCHKPHYYPRTLCPFCLGETDWKDASGEGVIYTFSVMRHTEEPYVIAYVKLAEGPTVMTNIVDCDADAVHIDQKVKLVFKPTQGDGPPVPMFTPA